MKYKLFLITAYGCVTNTPSIQCLFMVLAKYAEFWQFYDQDHCNI